MALCLPEEERWLRANDREFNLSFKYAVSGTAEPMNTQGLPKSSYLFRCGESSRIIAEFLRSLIKIPADQSLTILVEACFHKYIKMIILFILKVLVRNQILRNLHCFFFSGGLRYFPTHSTQVWCIYLLLTLEAWVLCWICSGCLAEFGSIVVKKCHKCVRAGLLCGTKMCE